MKSVQSIAEEIVAREGGYVNDPDDPGGATNRGVTIGTLRRLGLDLDGDGDVDGNDLRRLTKRQAAQVFLTHYFEKPKINQLPEILQASVFDMQVNAGANAIRILQRLLGEFDAPLVDDGALGPISLGAARDIAARAPHHLADAYGIARRNYYYALGDARPKSRKYARRRDGGKGGWITRAEDFMDEKYHLTHEEHLERTAAWI